MVDLTGVHLRTSHNRPPDAGWRQALEAARVTRQDRVFVALADAWSARSECLRALQDLGAATPTVDDLSSPALERLTPTVLVSTPTDALLTARGATRDGFNLSDGPLRLVVVTGEPGGSTNAARHAIERGCGARCFDVYALKEIGSVGWSCPMQSGGIHLDDSSLAIEALEPESERRVEPGALGELVLSTPRIQFRTGDLVRLTYGECVCGRRGPWAPGGILGRQSELLRVYGCELLPSAIGEIVFRHPAIVDFRLRAYGRRNADSVAIELEAQKEIASEGDRARVTAEVSKDLKRSLGIRLHCDIVPPGALSADLDPFRRARRLIRS